MARIGNEAKLLLKLAKARTDTNTNLYNMPHPFRDNDKLREAYVMGIREGLQQYQGTLDTIVAEMEQH